MTTYSPQHEPNMRIFDGPDGTPITEVSFVEEPLGLTVDDGCGWPRFDFGQSIGPDQRYTIARKLGWGMHSSTWLARDNITAQYVAVKASTGAVTARPEAWENEALSRVSQLPTSPHCLTLLDRFVEPGRVASDGNHLCLVTPLYGGNVRDLARASLPKNPSPNAAIVMPYALAKHILLHILRGIAHTHSRGVIHTDVKSDNVFFSPHLTPRDIETWLSSNPPRRNPPEQVPLGVVQSAVSQPLPMISVDAAMAATYVLSDFSSASDAAAINTSPQTTPPKLRAPEVHLYGRWSTPIDIWSFGCLIFELVCHAPLFKYQPDCVSDMDAVEDALFYMTVYSGEKFGDEIDRWPMACNYFDSNRELKKQPTEPLEPGHSLKDPIEVYVDLPEQEVTSMADIMRRCLRLNPANRATALELLEDPWWHNI